MVVSRRWQQVDRAVRLLALLLLLSAAAVVRAQDVEPRAYSNAPIGVNFLIAGAAYTRGGLPLDPALPIEDEHLQTSSLVFAFVHVFDIMFGNSAKFNVAVPYTDLSGSAVYAWRKPIERKVEGFCQSLVWASSR